MKAEHNSNIARNAIETIEKTQTKLIRFLYEGEIIHISNIEYMNCYNLLCEVHNNHSHDDNQIVFNWFSSQMEQYLEKQFQNKLDGLEGEAYLQRLRDEWCNLQLYLFWLKFIFTKFDLSFQSLRGHSLTGKTFTLLRDNVFVRNQASINAIIFDFLNQDREDLQVPFTIVSKTIQYIVDLGFGHKVQLQKFRDSTGFSSFTYTGLNVREDLSYYQIHFANQLIDNTQSFWKKKSAQWLSSMSVPEYVRNAKTALQKEKERAQNGFHWSLKQYIDTCEVEIISKNAKELITNASSGIAQLIKQNRFDDIQELYLLLNRRREDTIPLLADEIQEYVKLVLTEINKDPTKNSDWKEYIRGVIAFYKKIDLIIKDQLGKEQDIQKARDKAFQLSLNAFEKSIFYLAKHCDQELRQGMKGDCETEIEEKMQDVVDIFLCFYSRDTFIMHYQKFLQNRLLQGTSLSNQNETKLITLLKKEMGRTTTNKLSEMCNDISVNYEMMSELRKKLRETDEKKCDEIDWKISILASGHWTIQRDLLDLPQELTWIADNYVKLYKEKNHGRKVDWAFSQGNAEVLMRFDKKRYTLDVSNYQLLILLPFNSWDTYSFKDLIERVRLPEPEMNLHLIALCKAKIFIRENENDLEEFSKEETIRVNLNFVSKMIKIRVHPHPDLKKAIKAQGTEPQEPQNLELQGELKKLREHQLDACIVRVMKSRKQLQLNELNVEIVKLLGHIFKPQPIQIKQRIESLIERDYLMRSNDDRTKFIYKP